MPLPLFWIGGAIASVWVGKKLVEHAEQIDTERQLHDQPLRSDQDERAMVKSPSDVLTGDVLAELRPGAIVCCGIFGVFQHTGIYIGDDTVVELHGSGLVKAVSLSRFIDNRSGRNIFVACDSHAEPLVGQDIEQRASTRIFDFENYDVMSNNCHQFVLRCLDPGAKPITTFEDLNKAMSQYFNRAIYWDKVKQV